MHIWIVGLRLSASGTVDWHSNNYKPVMMKPTGVHFKFFRLCTRKRKNYEFLSRFSDWARSTLYKIIQKNDRNKVLSWNIDIPPTLTNFTFSSRELRVAVEYDYKIKLGIRCWVWCSFASLRIRHGLGWILASKRSSSSVNKSGWILTSYKAPASVKKSGWILASKRSSASVNKSGCVFSRKVLSS